MERLMDAQRLLAILLDAVADCRHAPEVSGALLARATRLASAGEIEDARAARFLASEVLDGIKARRDRMMDDEFWGADSGADTLRKVA